MVTIKWVYVLMFLFLNALYGRDSTVCETHPIHFEHLQVKRKQMECLDLKSYCLPKVPSLIRRFNNLKTLDIYHDSLTGKSFHKKGLRQHLLYMSPIKNFLFRCFMYEEYRTMLFNIKCSSKIWELPFFLGRMERLERIYVNTEDLGKKNLERFRKKFPHIEIISSASKETLHLP